MEKFLYQSGTYAESHGQLTGARAVARALLSSGAVQFDFENGFSFASGMRAPIYIDGRRIMQNASYRAVLCEAFLAHEQHRFDMVAGVATGGIAPGLLFAEALAKEFVYVRSSHKEHGLKRKIEGGDVAGKRVLVVEDMVTTGGSSIAAVDALRAEGAQVTQVLSLVSYGFVSAQRHFSEAGLEAHTLTSVPVVLEEAYAIGMVSEEQYQKLMQWLRQSDL